MTLVVMAERHRPSLHPQLHAGLIGHVSQNIGPYAGIEEDVRNPAALEGFIAAVAGRQGVCEFAEKPAPKPVITVYGTYSSAGEHTAKPGRLLHHQHGSAAARRLNGRRRTASPTTNHHHIVLPGTSQQAQSGYDQPASHF